MKISKKQLKQIIKEEINEIFGFKKKEEEGKEARLTRITMEDIMKELGETAARSLKNDPSNAEQFENLKKDVAALVQNMMKDPRNPGPRDKTHEPKVRRLALKYRRSIN
tara:strand:- start:291 stop:617 length:327 start_codon:yes stop_codon:yes gene_type:complete